MASQQQSAQKHRTYYIRDGTAIIKAENTLFRVHRYFLERESPYFREHLVWPVSPGSSAEGSSDSNPLNVHVSAAEFEKFLWVFYNPDYSIWEAPTQDWETILQLAHLWSFDKVKNLAFRELEKKEIPILDRLVLYQSYGAGDDILIPRYAELCARDEFLTVEEGDRLGMSAMIMIARVRETIRSPSSDGSKSPLSKGVDQRDICVEIESLRSASGTSGVGIDPKGKGKSKEDGKGNKRR